MGLASILSGLGSQAAGEFALKATRKYLKKRKAEQTTKAKTNKKPLSSPRIVDAAAAIRERKRRQTEELNK